MAKLATCLQMFVFLALANQILAAKQQADPTQSEMLFQYHNGPLLSGKISINLIWYGKFTPSQKAIISDFITSLSSPTSKTAQPSVATWWKGTQKYFQVAHSSNKKASSPLVLSMGAHLLDERYSLGKSLTSAHIQRLAARGGQANAINVVLTSADVTIDGFCMSRCGTHGHSSSSKVAHLRGKSNKFAYIWVGNSQSQCAGQCAWPFHQPIYCPQSPPLVAPNNDVGLDGMVMNLASLLAATATNPFGNGSSPMRRSFHNLQKDEPTNKSTGQGTTAQITNPHNPTKTLFTYIPSTSPGPNTLTHCSHSHMYLPLRLQRTSSKHSQIELS